MVGTIPCHCRRNLSLPFKANADHRDRIPKQRFRTTNWSEYDAALRGRGSLTIWFTDAAIATWKAEPRTTLSTCRPQGEDANGSAVGSRVIKLPRRPR